MAIASNKNTPRNTYTATGCQTEFTIGFEFFKIEDVKVYRNGSLLTYNASPSSVSQYKITGTASASDDAYEFGAGGTVTLGAGATADDLIVIIRDIVLERTSDFPTTGAFDITTLNTQLDTITSMLSDIKQQSDRSVKLLDTDTISATITLPAKATRQDKVLSFDSNGNAETTVNTAGLATLSSITSDITTVAGISSNVTTVAGMNATHIANVSGKATEIGLLGTADAVADMNTLGTTQTVSDMNTLAAISGLNSLASNSANVTTVANNLASVNNFAEVYRIASSAPTTSLNIGDLYFDTTANELKVYKSSGWAAAGSTVNGTSARFKYTASGGQTTFTGSDDNGNTLAYDAGFIDVYLNGAKLVNGTDVTVTSGTSVVLAAGATASDIISIVAYGTFNVASINASNITSGVLGTARGGTGLGSIGSAGQALVVNTGGNALEFSTIQASEITTQGNVFSNYNTISSNTTTTLSSTKNSFLAGDITVANNITWTISGSGSLTII